MDSFPIYLSFSTLQNFLEGSQTSPVILGMDMVMNKYHGQGDEQNISDLIFNPVMQALT